MKELAQFTTDQLLRELRRRCSNPAESSEVVPDWAMEVIEVCASVWGVSPDQILLRNNQPVPSAARTAAVGIVHIREPHRTLTSIARAFRRGDHTCINVAIKRCDTKCNKEPEFRHKLTEALKRLKIINHKCSSNN